MDDAQVPNVPTPLNNLTQNLSDFQLSNSLSKLEKRGQVKAIAIVHHHVDITVGLDGLVQMYAVGRVDHVVDLHFFLDGFEIRFRYLTHFHHFTSIGF